MRHAHLTLSTTGIVVMVVVVSAALVAMVIVLAGAGRRSASSRARRHDERAAARRPGLHPAAPGRTGITVGDPPGAPIEPGGHLVRPGRGQFPADARLAPAPGINEMSGPDQQARLRRIVVPLVLVGLVLLAGLVHWIGA